MSGGTPMSKKKADHLKEVKSQASESGVKLGSLLEPNFQQGFQLLKTKELPMKVSFLLLQLSQQVKKHHENYDNLRGALLEKYGQKDAEGKLVMNESKTAYVLANEESFNNDYKDLLNVDVEIQKIPMSYLEKVTIPPVLLQSLVNTVINPEL